MNPIIRPIFNLMNRLSYRGKFMLISSLFAIPLTLFSVQLAYTFHQEANQAKLTKTGLDYLQSATSLIEELETIRDITVIQSWHRMPSIQQELDTAKGMALEKVRQLQTSSSAEKHANFLDSLQRMLNNDNFVRGNESESIDGVYEVAQIPVDKAYIWRAKLSHGFISQTRNDSDIVAIINLLNESKIYAHALGQARTFGTLYLQQKYVDSYGASVLEESYQALSQLIEHTDIKTEEYQELLLAHPQIQLSQMNENINGARELLYEQLILSMSPTENPLKYFNSTSTIFQSIYQHNKTLFALSEHLVNQDYKSSIRQLLAFYCSVGVMGLLLLYLSTGLYKSVSVTTRDLMKSAAQVAAGNYEKPIIIQANDELSAVAEAMDAMRLSIKEREDKLAQMGQVDGLTQLYNRQFFDETLEMSLANSRRNLTPLTIVMMDIDHFKSVNDTYGHLAGDECLRQVAEQMKSQFKRKTDIVARYGGEEFIAILYGQTLEEAKCQTEKLRATIEASQIRFEESTISFTASFGLAALTPPEVAENNEIVGLADTLLYQSKDQGRNRLSAAQYSQKA